MSSTEVYDPYWLGPNYKYQLCNSLLYSDFAWDSSRPQKVKWVREPYVLKSRVYKPPVDDDAHRGKTNDPLPVAAPNFVEIFGTSKMFDHHLNKQFWFYYRAYQNNSAVTSNYFRGACLCIPLCCINNKKGITAMGAWSYKSVHADNVVSNLPIFRKKNGWAIYTYEECQALDLKGVDGAMIDITTNHMDQLQKVPRKTDMNTYFQDSFGNIFFRDFNGKIRISFEAVETLEITPYIHEGVQSETNYGFLEFPHTFAWRHNWKVVKALPEGTDLQSQVYLLHNTYYIKNVITDENSVLTIRQNIPVIQAQEPYEYIRLESTGNPLNPTEWVTHTTTSAYWSWDWNDLTEWGVNIDPNIFSYMMFFRFNTQTHFAFNVYPIGNNLYGFVPSWWWNSNGHNYWGSLRQGSRGDDPTKSIYNDTNYTYKGYYVIPIELFRRGWVQVAIRNLDLYPSTNLANRTPYESHWALIDAYGCTAIKRFQDDPENKLIVATDECKLFNYDPSTIARIGTPTPAGGTFEAYINDIQNDFLIRIAQYPGPRSNPGVRFYPLHELSYIKYPEFPWLKYTTSIDAPVQLISIDPRTIATKGDLQTLARISDLTNLSTKSDLATLATKQDIENLDINVDTSQLLTKAEFNTKTTEMMNLENQHYSEWQYWSNSKDAVDYNAVQAMTNRLKNIAYNLGYKDSDIAPTIGTDPITGLPIINENSLIAHLAKTNPIITPKTETTNEYRWTDQTTKKLVDLQTSINQLPTTTGGSTGGITQEQYEEIIDRLEDISDDIGDVDGGSGGGLFGFLGGLLGAITAKLADIGNVVIPSDLTNGLATGAAVAASEAAIKSATQSAITASETAVKNATQTAVESGTTQVKNKLDENLTQTRNALNDGFQPLAEDLQDVSTTMTTMTDDLAKVGTSVVNESTRVITQTSSLLDIMKTGLTNFMSEMLVEQIVSQVTDETTNIFYGDTNNSTDVNLTTVYQKLDNVIGLLNTMRTEINEDLLTINSNIDTINSNITTLHSDLTTANSNINTIQSDMNGLSNEHTVILQAIGGIDNNVSDNISKITGSMFDLPLFTRQIWSISSENPILIDFTNYSEYKKGLRPSKLRLLQFNYTTGETSKSNDDILIVCKQAADTSVELTYTLITNLTLPNNSTLVGCIPFEVNNHGEASYKLQNAQIPVSIGRNNDNVMIYMYGSKNTKTPLRLKNYATMLFLISWEMPIV